MDFLTSNTFWTGVAAIAALFSALAAAGFFRKEKIVKGELYTTQQERDDLRKRLAKAEVRLDAIDPERFIDKIDESSGKYDALEKLALAFSEKQSEAFGRAAEIMAEQRIWDSDVHGKPAVEEAQRFARIGLAANPESIRLKELRTLAEARNVAIERSEPIETLNWEGMSGVELNLLAVALFKDGKYVLAEIAARRSVPLAISRFGLVSSNAAATIGFHAHTLEKLGIFDEAEPLYRKALEIYRSTLGKSNPDYARHLNNLASFLNTVGRFEEAELLYQEVLEIDRKTLGEAHPDYARHLNNLAELLRETGRFEGAETIYGEALEIARTTLGEAHPDYAISLNNLAKLLFETNRTEEAEPMYREALEITRRTLGEAHPNYASRLNNLAELLDSTGRTKQAEPLYREVVAVFEAALGPDHPHTHQARETLKTVIANRTKT